MRSGPKATFKVSSSFLRSKDITSSGSIPLGVILMPNHLLTEGNKPRLENSEIYFDNTFSVKFCKPETNRVALRLCN